MNDTATQLLEPPRRRAAPAPRPARSEPQPSRPRQQVDGVTRAGALPMVLLAVGLAALVMAVMQPASSERSLLAAVAVTSLASGVGAGVRRTDTPSQR